MEMRCEKWQRTGLLGGIYDVGIHEVFRKVSTVLAWCIYDTKGVSTTYSRGSKMEKKNNQLSAGVKILFLYLYICILKTIDLPPEKIQCCQPLLFHDKKKFHQNYSLINKYNFLFDGILEGNFSL